MLSICIPIYNSVPVEFIQELNQQLSETDQAGEILLANDASETDISAELEKVSALNTVRIITNETNLGRSKTRNRLAKEASGNYLLFADGDSGVENSDFLKNYLPYCIQDTVCCGGTSYNSTKPKKSLMLRWKYGHLRESVSADIRNLKPAHSFTTHQFLIDRDLFMSIQFNEKIQGYGHEDTMFGMELEQKGIKIHHIDNPLLHLGLEPNAVFLNKSKEAVQNLAKLYTESPNKEWFKSSISLVRFYESLKRKHVLFLVELACFLLKPIIRPNLNGSSPSLRFFDLFKLHHFSHEMSRQSKSMQT